jgi:hypothetical protein
MGYKQGHEGMNRRNVRKRKRKKGYRDTKRKRG